MTRTGWTEQVGVWSWPGKEGRRKGGGEPSPVRRAAVKVFALTAPGSVVAERPR